MMHKIWGRILGHTHWILGVTGVVLWVQLQRAEGVQGGDETGAVAGLVREIAAQQEQIVANQAQIEERLARVAEDVRLARLFSARSGGGRANP